MHDCRETHELLPVGDDPAIQGVGAFTITGVASLVCASIRVDLALFGIIIDC